MCTSETCCSQEQSPRGALRPRVSLPVGVPGGHLGAAFQKGPFPPAWLSGLTSELSLLQGHIFEFFTLVLLKFVFKFRFKQVAAVAS